VDIASAVSSACDVAGKREDTRETSIDFSLVFAVAFCCRCSSLLLLETPPERRRKVIKTNEKTVSVLVVVFVI
jgi:hypothetical protein